MGKLSETINQMIRQVLLSSTWTSAGDTKVENFIREFRGEDNPDLESEIKEIIGEGKAKKKPGVSNQDDDGNKIVKNIKTEIRKQKDQLKLLSEGNIGAIKDFSTSQMTNLQNVVNDPSGFIMRGFMKKFAKGVGVLIILELVRQAIKLGIEEALKPGRWLDRRFKRDITKEILAFRKREDQQRLKQGLSNIIITSRAGLRGGKGQAVNTFNMVAGRQKFPDSIGMDPFIAETSGMDLSRSKGERFRNRR